MSDTERILRAIVPGSIIKIAKYGSVLTGSNLVSDTARPTAPSAETPGPWISLGKIKSSQPNTEYKTNQVEGVADDGTLYLDEINIPTKRVLKFTTQDISPEAVQLMYGLQDTPVDGTVKKQRPWTSIGEIKCWLMCTVVDIANGSEKLYTLTFTGRLRLPAAPNLTTEPVTCEFEILIRPNPLDDFESLALNKPINQPA